MESEDQRIVYGATCTWWDSIDRATTTGAMGIPCCPQCGSVLFETPKDEWQAAIDLHNQRKPGYAIFMQWLRGKCFEKLPHAMSQWCTEMVDPV